MINFSSFSSLSVPSWSADLPRPLERDAPLEQIPAYDWPLEHKAPLRKNPVVNQHRSTNQLKEFEMAKFDFASIEPGQWPPSVHEFETLHSALLAQETLKEQGLEVSMINGICPTHGKQTFHSTGCDECYDEYCQNVGD